MRTSTGRVLIVAAACLVAMTGCETSTKLSGLLGGSRGEPDTTASIEAELAEPTTTGSVAITSGAPQSDPVVNAATPKLLGRDGTISISARNTIAPPISVLPKSTFAARSSCTPKMPKPGSGSPHPMTGSNASISPTGPMGRPPGSSAIRRSS